ncbi:MAG: c-type cytochrome [Pseudomonadota bacterium]
MKYRFMALALLHVLPAVPAGAAPDGEALYAAYCVQCHGVSGDGNGINAAHLSVQPRSHIDREEMSARTDEELFKVIEQGGVSINKSVLMPPWGGNLDESRINALVEYLRVLCCEE